ncbi:hypothetical protein JL193_09500 [Polaribacter batillariae]|uniref:Bacterial toxin 44 domain-containing protein n=1 Tax=Polaribacter batillariae TaxID=2808900 RepID=A0ABX7SRW0_9FLAO|nr:hypothetical protein [Polaribacter batillariae]QTD36394.1 hypothetical protein JL193_09500 [Polaribacter batillariae]
MVLRKCCASNFWKAAGTITAGSLSGGVGSVISGGKFWDGFRNGAISSSLNHVVHIIQKKIEKVNLQKSKNKIKEILKTFKEANRNKKLSNLFDIIEPNDYADGIYNEFSEELTLNEHKYKLRVKGYNVNDFSKNKSYYKIFKAGFGYLDRFSSFKPSPQYNSGYYRGFYLTGNERNYLITIGAKTTAGYNYLKKIYNGL